MKLIVNSAELQDNMDELDSYLNRKKGNCYSFALCLIKKGICFVASCKQGEYHFYPSRFIGYANNKMSCHQNNRHKDGRLTNKAISSLLDQKPTPDSKMDLAYQSYCKKLGITANSKGSFGVERKCWIV